MTLQELKNISTRKEFIDGNLTQEDEIKFVEITKKGDYHFQNTLDTRINYYVNPECFPEFTYPKLLDENFKKLTIIYN